MNRAARRTRAQAMLLAGQVAQAQYKRRLLSIFRGLHSPVYRADAVGEGWRRRLDDVAARVKAVRAPAGAAFDEMAARTSEANMAAAKALLGAAPAQTGVAEHVAEFRRQNLDLIGGAAEDYLEDVRDVIENAPLGTRAEDLADLLRERAGVSESRAELIAVDQTLKLNGQLNQMRQVNAGVERYVWSTSHDERVRPMHRDLDGSEQSWADPPETDEDGNANHPGQDFRCRCVALPVLPELD